MSLGVLNNISALYAENNLNQTQSNLQNTLTQLSSGSRINSGADDAAGLAIANGLEANSSALSQSSANATSGVGFLQVADGALSQVTNLLNRAVTLATEAGGGTLSNSQMSAANQEYQDILTQINTIGSTTEYNNIQVFGSNTSLNALTWAQGSGTAASSATATAQDIAAGSFAGGGASTATNVSQGGSFGTAAAVTWTAGGTGQYSVLTTGALGQGAALTGSISFTPTAATGAPTPNAINVDLGTVTQAGQSLSDQAAALQTAINTQAGNANEYTVSVVNGDQLQIGIGTHGATDQLTGFGTVTNSVQAASQTSYTMTVTNNDMLSGTLSLTPQSLTATGQSGAISFTGSGSSSVTTSITSGDTLSGSVTVTTNSGVVGAGTPAALTWTNSGTSSTASITNNSKLSGGFTITPTGFGSAVDVNLAGTDTSSLVSTINTALGSAASDYTVSYSGGTLTIAASSAGTTAGISAISIANDTSSGNGVATQTPPGTIAKTIDLDGVSTSNLQNVMQAALGSEFTATYNSTSGAVSIAASTQGGTDGITSLTLSNNTVGAATPGSVSGSPVSINLSNINTANLASTVDSALNAGSASGNYNVSYDSGTGKLTVALTSQATTAGISALTFSGTITQSAANTATLAVADGDTLGGTIDIGQTIGGSAQSAVKVDLSGISTANNGKALIDAVNTALGNNAKNYDVTYSATSGTGTLSIAVNAAGHSANVNSVSIANDSTTAAMESQTTDSAIVAGSNVLGNFTLTPAGSGNNTPISVDLSTTNTAKLVSAVQTALGTSASNYTVGYDATAGTLSIGVSKAGLAAGVTGFTLAENATQAASVLSTSATGGVNIYTSDGTATGSKNYNVTVGTLSDDNVGSSDLNSALGMQITTTVGGASGTGGMSAGGSQGASLTGTDLTSQANAEAALQTVDNAISAVAYQRGQVGANINTLTAASNISSSEQTNITSAQNAITATDYASTTSNMSKYEILTQTGISALAQANSTQQMVTKLLQ